MSNYVAKLCGTLHNPLSPSVAPLNPTTGILLIVYAYTQYAILVAEFST